MAVRALVLDQQRRVVADLGHYLSPGPVTGLSVDFLRFVPEVNRLQVGRDNAGGLVSWNGVGDGGVALPNGYYRLQVKAPGGSEVEAEFYIEHQPWNAGSVAVSLLPGGHQARIRWNYSEPVNLSFDLYNLAGELVWQGRGGGMGGELRWGLETSSGRVVANGIYLLVCRASSLDASVTDERVIKLAVAR